jgi:predicted esterase
LCKVHRFTLAMAAAALSWCAHARADAPASEDGEAPAPEVTQTEPSWCAPELETLPGDVCFFAASPPEGTRRTLVIFLHGLVQHGAGWQHDQQRGIARGAKRLGFAVLAPRGRRGARRNDRSMVAWPTSADAQAKHEGEVVAEWTAARALIEERQGAPFDEVFVVGFSNGAYYAASLALRGRLAVDGYAVFAGGVGHGAARADARVPIFVAISGKDDTADDARALAAMLKKYGWPHLAETRAVGHMIADVHLDHALAYLRERKRALTVDARATPR